MNGYVLTQFDITHNILHVLEIFEDARLEDVVKQVDKKFKKTFDPLWQEIDLVNYSWTHRTGISGGKCTTWKIKALVDNCIKYNRNPELVDFKEGCKC